MKYEYWLYDYNNVGDYSTKVSLLLDNFSNRWRESNYFRLLTSCRKRYVCAPRVLPNHSNLFDLRPNRYAQNSERTSNRSSPSRAAIWLRSRCIFRLSSFEVMSLLAEGVGACLSPLNCYLAVNFRPPFVHEILRWANKQNVVKL